MKKIFKNLKEYFYNRYGITKAEFNCSLSSLFFGLVYIVFCYGLIVIFC